MSLKRILAILAARNLEFMRDRSSLGWNIVVPLILLLGLAVIFSGESADKFKVAVLTGGEQISPETDPFFATRFIDFIPVDSEQAAIVKVARHQLDMLFDVRGTPRYWVNPESPNGYIVERLLLQVDPSAHKELVTGKPIRYVDWLVPGVLGMNMMFSCLFGVGYVVVRYRKNGFLKRLRATPLSALEFILAQVLSRLIIIMTITTFVFSGVKFLLDIAMSGSYLALVLVALLGSGSLISLALVVAARVSSEELAGGLLNMISWPMMLLSGVFFSMEGTSRWLQSISEFLPLTQILEAARAVMIDGAGVTEIWPHLAALAAMTIAFLLLGAALFRWRFV
jgi:ABC-2 type transport system permease protein